ncbi:MAG TPA: hypothetical protein VMM92_02240 [Thermoanaerobaculia bacterium]|nr:hypothetical protein [Thermoanaerobaculia bacterium]
MNALPPRVFERSRPRLLGLAVGLAVVGLGLFWQIQAKRQAAEALRRQEAREERRAQNEAAAITLRQARRAWVPGEGVTEAAAGPLRSWLAIQPVVPLDWDFEQTAEHPRREIPIRSVLLNNSYAAVTLAPSPGEPWWRVWITEETGGATVAAWQPEPFEEPSLLPADRREWRLLWDGRDARPAQGNALLPPGPYAVHSEVAGPAGLLQTKLNFALEDQGEIVEQAGGVESGRGERGRHHLGRLSLLQKAERELAAHESVQGDREAASRWL